MADFNKIFTRKPVIGMIHLAGAEPVSAALHEMEIYEAEGVDGVIVENYHGTDDDVELTLKQMSRLETRLVVGVNILPNEFSRSFRLAREYGAKFIQLDHVAGTYREGKLQHDSYSFMRRKHNDMAVLGGVWPKYYHPVSGSELSHDISEAVTRADAIVVTGQATGKETPFEKIKEFIELVNNRKPVVIGAGLNVSNVYEQLKLAGGAIVGSCFKPAGNTHSAIDAKLVRDFVSEADRAR
ncbi:hypothetical protein KY311_01010 [Candidatus Woesearchaeota archaeon]|nr:hypothetical protein [Candidatus Woesearchaeota archaeon]